MRELHLFAGAGGGILGGMLLGHTTVCAVEIEPYCRQVLLQRQRDGILPKFPIWDDVCTFDGKTWRGKVDIVAGGFPCQDISSAGGGQEFLEPEVVYGRRCPESLVKYNPSMRSWKILHCLWEEDLPLSSLTLPNWGMMHDGECWELIMSELSIIEPACGWLPTPVASEKHDGMGVAWKLARLFKGDRIARYLGKIWIKRNLLEKDTKICPNPCWQEWRMMWPINWTGLSSLEMDKFQEWRQQHSDFFHNE